MRQNQANVERDWTGLTTLTCLVSYIIQVLFCGEKLTGILLVLSSSRYNCPNDFFKTESGKCREGLNRPNNFEVFRKLILNASIILWRKVDRYFAHGCHGVDITWHPSYLLLLLEMAMQGTFKKHRSENALQISCMSQPWRMIVPIDLLGLCLKYPCIHLTDLFSLWKTREKFSIRQEIPFWKESGVGENSLQISTQIQLDEFYSCRNNRSVSQCLNTYWSTSSFFFLLKAHRYTG